MSERDQGPDDAVLVRWSQQGHEDAFELLVRRHRDRAHRTALRLLGDRYGAEDVVQDAFVAAWQALPRFRGDSAFSTWLYRIVTNAALNRAQRDREVAHGDGRAVPAVGVRGRGPGGGGERGRRPGGGGGAAVTVRATGAAGVAYGGGVLLRGGG